MEHKTILITGGSSGIGLNIAECMLKLGAQVVVVDLNPPEQLLKSTDPSQLLYIYADLSEFERYPSIVEEAIHKFGKVDILINNAGFQHVCALENFPTETWNKMISVMLTGPFLLSKHLWPHMKKNTWGRIINMGSIHSKVASLNKIAYVSAKHGLEGMTKSLALEGGPLGITANMICPSYVNTPLVEKQIKSQALSLGISEDEVQQGVFFKQLAIKRFIEPQEITDLIKYLCSDSAQSVSGSSFVIDGGWTAQ